MGSGGAKRGVVPLTSVVLCKDYCLMLNVTFTKDAPQENYSIITVNGSQDKGSFCFDGGSSGWYCDLHHQGVFNKLSEYSFKEVGELLSGFNFPVRQSEESA